MQRHRSLRISALSKNYEKGLMTSSFLSVCLSAVPLSVCLSVVPLSVSLPAWNNSALMGRILMKFHI